MGQSLSPPLPLRSSHSYCSTSERQTVKERRPHEAAGCAGAHYPYVLHGMADHSLCVYPPPRELHAVLGSLPLQGALNIEDLCPCISFLSSLFSKGDFSLVFRVGLGLLSQLEGPSPLYKQTDVLDLIPASCLSDTLFRCCLLRTLPPPQSHC
jgi:hypothetical protein